jgi:Na+/H+ antiporter NhaD/arsenite permease-like protein
MTGQLAGPDHVVFDLLVSAVFVIIALMLLFPSNAIIPLDRRLSSLFGATLCSGIMTLFPATNVFNTGGFVDFNVLLVLTSIMVINYLLLRQPWLANAVKSMQSIIQADVDRGFYAVSIISFLASPFILNDGLCLMLVHPVLDAFVASATVSSSSPSSTLSPERKSKSFLRSDAFYYMLTIACSANIGSTMTFSGNPQNLIVAQYVGRYMNCGTFFMYMFVPSTISWLITISLLNYYRKQAAAAEANTTNELQQHGDVYSPMVSLEEEVEEEEEEEEEEEDVEEGGGAIELREQHLVHRKEKTQLQTSSANRLQEGSEVDQIAIMASSSAGGGEEEGATAQQKLSKPHAQWDTLLQEDASLDPMSCPKIVFPGFLLLIVLEFTGTYPLPGLFTVLTVFIIVAVILTNYYFQSFRFMQLQQQTHRNNSNSNSNSDRNSTGKTDRRFLAAMKTNKVVPPSAYIAHISANIEDLFHNHIDYNLLVIFIGLFIVSGSFLTTHIPRTIWSTLAGPKPFTSFSSVLVLSIYIVGMSQLVGNVPVVYMAKEEVRSLFSERMVLKKLC